MKAPSFQLQFPSEQSLNIIICISVAISFGPLF